MRNFPLFSHFFDRRNICNLEISFFTTTRNCINHPKTRYLCTFTLTTNVSVTKLYFCSNFNSIRSCEPIFTLSQLKQYSIFILTVQRAFALHTRHFAILKIKCKPEKITTIFYTDGFFSQPRKKYKLVGSFFLLRQMSYIKSISVQSAIFVCALFLLPNESSFHVASVIT